jgi:hypothetical protein
MAMKNSLPLVASNKFMKQFEEMALDTADHKPHVNDTLKVWPHGAARLQ